LQYELFVRATDLVGITSFIMQGSTKCAG